MTHNDLRSSLESNFINGLISRLLSTVETGSILEADDLINTISSIAIHRIHSVITELEKCLTEKSCSFHMVKSSENSKIKADFIEEILLIMRVIDKSLSSFGNNNFDHPREGESFQSLSKNTCNKLMSTVGGVVFYHSQFQDFSTAVKLDQACGKILTTLSEINQEAALAHIKQVLKKCLEPQAESRGNFYTLKSLQYMLLHTDSLLTLFGNIADSVDAPTNSGKWKKNAMLDLTTPLRLCVFQWLNFDASLVQSIFSTESRGDDHPNIVFLLNKMEPWASGAKKRSSVWPLINVLVTLMPRAFQAAVLQLKATNPPVSSSKLSIEAKILKRTIDSLNPTAMQSVLQKDSALFTELAAISLVLMMKVAGTLKRRLSYPTIPHQFASSAMQNGGLAIQTAHAIQRAAGASAGSTSSGAEAALQVLWAFLVPHLDRLREIVFGGNCPSQHYYSAIAPTPFTTFTPGSTGSNTWEGSMSSATKTTVVEELTPDGMFDAYMWALFYGDQPKYLNLMMRILGPKIAGSATISSFIRVGAIRALNFILGNDYVDRQGKTPTWRLTAASEVRIAVIDIITQFRNQYLLSNDIVDKERDVISSLEGQSKHMDSVDSASDHPTFASPSKETMHDFRFDVDPESVVAVLKLVRYNPWFAFVRRSFDESTDNLILATVFTSHLTTFLRDIMSIASMDNYGDYDLPVRAEQAFTSLIDVKYISLWTPKDPFNGVLNVNAILLKYTACELLHCGSNEQVKGLRLLRCMCALLTNINEYIGEEDLLRGATSASEAVDALVHVAVSAAEAALLIHFCSGDTDVIRLASTCLGLLCVHNEYLVSVEYRIADSSGGNEYRHEDCLLNGIYVRPTADVWPIYREMAANTGQILSIKLQQKSIRAFLSRMPCRTQGMNWALYEIMHRWVSFNTYIHSSNGYSIPASQSVAFDEWRNYTGFLCALGSGLSQALTPCTDDYLAQILCRAHINEDNTITPTDAISRPTTPVGYQSEDKETGKNYTPRYLVRSMLHLVLLQHADRRVSVDVFMTIGMYLAPALTYLLFQELGVLQDVMLDVLTKRCDAGTTVPTRNLGGHEGNGRHMMQDFDSFISEMSLPQINGFVNAILTMLQMIFDREWQKANVPLAVTSRPSEITVQKEIGSIVERMIHRLVLTVLKLHKQLEIDDSSSPLEQPANRSVSTASANFSGYQGLLEVQQNTSEQFRLKKKTSDMLETLIVKRGAWKPSSNFHMRLLNVLMDWTNDCISHIEMSIGANSATAESAGRSAYSSSGRNSSMKYARTPVMSKRLSGNSAMDTSSHGASTMSNTTNTAVISADDMSLFKGSELACVKAIAVLLQGMELSCEAEEEVSSSISPAPTPTGSKKTMSDVDKKSKIFYKYFHVLQNVLLSCFVLTGAGSREELQNVAVNALCNLLHANTGIGLQHMVSAVSTHDNQSLREALLRVFTEVLSRRMDPLTFGASQKLASYEDALYELMTALLAPDRELARLLCVSARGREAEEVAKALLLICEKHNATTVLKLLDWTIEHEIVNTARLGTLFRSESMGTKLMGAYFGSRGRAYLVNTLRNPIQQYLKSSLVLEVDPNKGADPSKVKENMTNLQNQTEIFLSAIIDSVHQGCPNELKHILGVLREETVKKFGSTEGCDRIAVAGYTFLRFFCPAIAMPSKFGLTLESDEMLGIEPPMLNKQQSRGLLLIAKILQNLANGTHFFEECMEPLNPWIDRHAEAISYFCYEISSEDTFMTELGFSEDSQDHTHAVSGSDNTSTVAGLTSAGLEGDTVVADSDTSDEDDDEVDRDRTLGITSPTTREKNGLKKHDDIDAEGQEYFSSSNWSEELQTALVSIHKYMYVNHERIERLITPSVQMELGTDSSSATSSDISSQTVGQQRSKSTPALTSGHYGDYPIVREKLAGLMSRLGEPPEDVPQIGEDTMVKLARADSMRSECDIFLSDITRKSNSRQLIEAVKDSQIFYGVPPPGGVASGGPTTFFFVCRRVTAETDPPILLYVIASEIRTVVKAGGTFDLVVDSSSFNTDAELPMWSYSVFWGKLKTLLGAWCENSLRKVYVLYPSIVVVMSARKVLKKWGVKTRSVSDKVEVVSPTQLIAMHPHLSDKIPRSTTNIEAGSIKKWPALLHDREVTISISGSLLLVQTADKFGGVEYKRSDILSLHLVDNISAGTLSKPGKKQSNAPSDMKRKFAMQSSSRNNPETFDQSVILTYTASQSTRTLKLLCSHSAHLVSALSIALTQVRQQRALEEASKWAGTRVVSPDAIPGMLLHIGLLNLFSELPNTRKASYLLLCQMKHTYELPLSLPTESKDVTGLFVPSNLVNLAVSISRDLAVTRPEYGKELLFECFQAIKRPVTKQFQKLAVVLYLTPWLPLLELFYQQCTDNISSGLSTDDDVVPLPLTSTSLQRIESTPSLSTSSLAGVSSPTSSVVSQPASSTIRARRKSAIDVTPSKATSSATSSFIYTTPEAASVNSPKTGLGSVPAMKKENSKDMNLKLMGGRVVDISMEQLLEDVEELFEISLVAACDDRAVGTVMYLEIWKSISHMPMLSSLAMKYFVKRWKAESSKGCSIPKVTNSARNSAAISSSREYSTPRKAAPPSSAAHASTRGGYSFLAQQTPPTQTVHDAVTGDARRNPDAQSTCAYCITMCEVAALIGLESPNEICELLLAEIHAVVTKICDATSSSSSRVFSRGSSKSVASDNSFSDLSLRPFQQREPHQMQSQQSKKQGEVPNAVVDGLNSFFSPPSGASIGSEIRAKASVGGSRKLNDPGYTSSRAPPSMDTSDTASVSSSSSHGGDLKEKRQAKVPTESLEVLESDWCAEITYLLRPLYYLVYHNADLLIDNTPQLLHLAVTLLSLGRATLMPHVHVLICSLIHAMISSASCLEIGDTATLSAPSQSLFQTNDEDGSPRTLSEESTATRKASVSSAPEYTDFAIMCTGESVRGWKSVLQEFNSDAFHLIFKKAPTLTPNNFERVATALGRVVEDPSSILCRKWRKVMWDLALSSAKKTAQSSQYSTFFLMVGSLIQNTLEPQAVNGCLCHVFEALKNVTDICIRHHFHDRDEPLLRPILFCLSNAIPLMETKRIQEVFWIGVLLLLYFPTSYLSGPIMLVHATVVELLARIQKDASRQGVRPRDLEKDLLTARQTEKGLNKYFKRLEKGYQSVIGVSFESSFSTAMSCLLLRGLQMTESKTRDLSEATLRLLMEHYQSHSEGAGENSSPRCISGYSVVLLSVWGDISQVSQPQSVMDTQAVIDRRFSTSPVPTASAVAHRRILITGKSRSAQTISTLPDDPVYRPAIQRQRSSSAAGLLPEKSLPLAPVSFFGEHNFPTNKSLVLFATTLLACIRTLQNMEEEQLFVHALLLQTIRELPTLLSVLYEVLFSEMSAAYALSLSKEGELSRAILDILNECLMSGFSRHHGKVRSGSTLASVAPTTGSEVDDIGTQHSVLASPGHAETTGAEIDMQQSSPGVSDSAKDVLSSSPDKYLANIDESSSPNTSTVPSLTEPMTTKSVSVAQVDAPFTRGSVQTLDVDSDDSATEGSGGRCTSSSSMEYLSELGFAGLLEGTYVYALGSSVVRGKCECGAFDATHDAKTVDKRNELCASCLRRKEAKHLISSAIWGTMRDFHLACLNQESHSSEEEMCITADQDKSQSGQLSEHPGSVEGEGNGGNSGAFEISGESVTRDEEV